MHKVEIIIRVSREERGVWKTITETAIPFNVDGRVTKKEAVLAWLGSDYRTERLHAAAVQHGVAFATIRRWTRARRVSGITPTEDIAA
jgi:hypothetical protein